MNDSFLNEIEAFSKDKLKKTQTDIYHLNGKKYIRKEGKLDENEIKITNEEILEIKQYSESAYLSRLSGYVIDLQPDNSIDNIIDGLYLSGDGAATNKQILDSKRITHILNATTNVENKFEPDIIYKNFPIYDLETQIIDFQSSFEFIEDALKQAENKVLVHCNQGVSRSASIVIGYLLKKRIFNTYNEAYNYVKAKRVKIMPNNGFKRQLFELEIMSKD
jgi:hypothetical protein